MINFYQTALQNYSKYLLDPNVELEPVFVTYEDETEFNDINNWTIEKIKQKTQQLIQQVLAHGSQNSLMNFSNKCPGNLKQQAIFHFTMMLKNKLKLKEQLTK